MTNNSSNGKTSIGKVVGLYLVVFGSVCFGYDVFFIKDSAIMSIVLLQSFGIIALGASIVGAKIIKPTKLIEEQKDEIQEN